MTLTTTAEGAAASISDYALVGDTRTAALISSAGAIDWMCIPNFDREPVFGRLVGGRHSGSFTVSIEGLVEVRRSYRAHSAILESSLRAATGAGRLTEGMVVDVSGELLPQLILVRRVECDHGSLRVRVNFDPRLGLPGTAPRASRRAGVLVCDWGSLAVGLQASPDLDLEPADDRHVELDEGEELMLIMTIADRSPVVFVSPDRARLLLDETDRRWREWAAGFTYDGPGFEAVIRSLITLALLTFAPSGAPVAAPTTSLPEVMGGSSNWDYRYSWPRDAGIGLAAFLALGKHEFAHGYLHWLLHASRLSRPRLNVLNTLYGKSCPKETEVGGVTGYRDSVPVRIGNAASSQHQLDLYGWVLDAAWLLTRAGEHLHGEFWRAFAGFADFVAAHWREPDAGLWESRGEPQHFVHSKLMAWLCLDRALRISSHHSTRERRLRTWRQERDALAEEIKRRGFDEGRQTYVQRFGSQDLDAALLLLPGLGFEDDPGRVTGTISAIRDELEVQDGLVYRYRRESEGSDGMEGAFLPCSFWLVRALACAGRQDEALRLFERLLRLANDVGLFSEEIDVDSKEFLGNFPQAFTHAALIQAALSLSEENAS